MGKVLREISKPSSSSSAAAAASFSGYAAPPPTTSVSVTETVNGTHHFKINGYSLSKGHGIGKYVASDTFNVGGYSWAIYFYPDGKSAKDNAAYVSLFIALASDGTDVRALFELTLLDQSGRERHKVHTHFGRMLESGPYTLKYRGSMWGYKRFFKRTALETSDYLKDDCLSVNCIVGVVKPRTEGPKIYSIAVPPSNIGQHFGQLLESGKGTDVTFEVDGEYLRRDVPFLNISYGELLKATNGFDTENMIGVGGFGSVFRGILEPHELPIAVKVFNLERRGASKSFMAECESLRNIRHRNLVKIITACSSVDFQGNDFKALVYEFMPNGSLEDWLHPHPRAAENERKSLTLLQQLDVVIDVASALDYLHNQSERPIIHCDLKPSNILLDQDMIAHVGDFGLSRILGEDDVQISHDHTSSFGIRGTIGYAAPEYGMGSNVSSQGDVFSFGTLLLEIFTGKKPTDENLEGLGLRQFVKMALPTKVMDTVDQRLLIKGEEEASQSKSDKVHECLISIFTIGLKCSEESPTTRMKINNALKDLQKIKNVLLK